MASVRVEGTEFVLDLNGSPKMQGYVERLPLFLKHGEAALDVITGKIMKGTTTWPKWVDPPLKDRLWDPWDRGTRR